ncbi:MAG: hypothetical protein JWO77_389 [Ilumatobacteraceae bacterium]|nr:hypothetical protein [Ilumatobacteraceae bacterium]
MRLHVSTPPDPDLAHLPMPPAQSEPSPPNRSGRSGWLVVPAIVIFAMVAGGGISFSDGSEQEPCGLACEGGPASVVIGLALVAVIPVVLAAVVALVVVRGIAVSKREGTWPERDANEPGPSGR